MPKNENYLVGASAVEQEHGLSTISKFLLLVELQLLTFKWI